MNAEESIRLLVYLLHEARPYLDRGPPRPGHGRQLAEQTDHVLGQLVKSYEPPAHPEGELSLALLPPHQKALLAGSLGRAVVSGFAYGFAIGRRMVITHAPLAEVQLRRVSSPDPGIDLIVGEQVKVMPLISFGEVPVSFEYELEAGEE